MGLLDDAISYFKFEGTIIGGTLSPENVSEAAEKQITPEQKETLDKELAELKAKISDTFKEKDKLIQLIEYQAKLRILIQRRLKESKKLPQEIVDKYNDVVTRIREIVLTQAGETVRLEWEKK